jgi:hypothetical protein
VDLIYEWTGKGIGWDIYGTSVENPHTCNPDANGFHSVATDKNYREWCADHYKALPVVIPGQLDISYGEHASGSPFLGLTGSLPQGHPGLNTTGGYYHMLHSHNEKEVTTDDIFPGGMMTMLIVEPWSVDLDVATGVVITGGSGTGSSGTTVLEASAASGQGNNLSPERTTLDFGNKNGNANSTITLMNTGVSPALVGTPVVANINGSNFSYISTTCSAAPVLINGNCAVVVRFNGPNNNLVNNPRTGTLTVPYNGAPLVIQLTGR